jgi:hypothetical protein
MYPILFGIYLAIGWAATHRTFFDLSFFGFSLMITCSVGMIIEIGRAFNYVIASGAQVAALRSIVWLDLLVIVLMEVVGASLSVQITKALVISQILVFFMLATCLALIPAEPSDEDSKEPSKYRVRGGLR